METFTKLLFFPLHSLVPKSMWIKLSVLCTEYSLNLIYSRAATSARRLARSQCWRKSCERKTYNNFFSIFQTVRVEGSHVTESCFDSSMMTLRGEEQTTKMGKFNFLLCFSFQLESALRACWKFAACDTARSTGWHVSFIKLVTFVLTGRTCAHGKVTARREWERDRTILIFIAEAAVSHCSMQAKSARVGEGRLMSILIKCMTEKGREVAISPDSVFLSNIHSFIPFIIHKVNFGWMLGTRHSSGLNSARTFFENIINFSFQNLPLSGTFGLTLMLLPFFVRWAVEK